MNMTVNITAAVALAAAVLVPAQAQSVSQADVVPLAALPMQPPPGEAEKVAPGNAVALSGGVPIFRDNVKYSDFRRGMDIAVSSAAAGDSGANGQRGSQPPAAVRDLSRLKLAFSPRGVAQEHQLLAASPAGLMTEGGWSGVERYIAVPGAGVYKLTEFDLTKTGGKFFLSSEAVNTTIDQSPAGAKSFVDGQGQLLEEVVWVSNGRFQMLSFMPETVGDGTQALRGKRTPSVSAVALAATLRR